METKVDLHVHSRYSNRPQEWVLRKLGAPESFSDPMYIYRTCKERGMKFVTISDHDCIGGALELMPTGDAFISCEVTTLFPEDGCKVHCLVTGITEQQWKEIDELRDSIYEFRDYLVKNNILYSCAHPLFQVNNMLQVEHIEKLILLFKRFEGLNGMRTAKLNDMARALFSGITPEDIERLANKHKLEPTGIDPHIKYFTGGSDDHGGVYIAGAYTVTPACNNVTEFLNHLHNFQHQPGGEPGCSLQFAHSLYTIAYKVYKEKFVQDQNKGNDLFENLIRRFLQGEPPPNISKGEKIKLFARKIIKKKTKKRSEMDSLLKSEFMQLIKQAELQRDMVSESFSRQSVDRRSFQIAARLTHNLTYEFLKRSINNIRYGHLMDSIQSLGALSPVILSAVPYLAAFRTQHKDELLLEEVRTHFQLQHNNPSGIKRAWITDTFADINGVCRTIHTLARQARDHQKELTVLTCLESEAEFEFPVHNFKPIGEFALPEYELQKMGFPPFLEILEYIEREKFTELIVSTPGTMGLSAILAAQCLRVPLIGIYHTDFPLYVRYLTQDRSLERLTWRYMHWFYNQMSLIYVPSEYYRRLLIEHGFDSKKMRLMPRGIDTDQFAPEWKIEEFWEGKDVPEGLNILYVGRISKEKNVDILIDAFLKLSRNVSGINLVLVGDGPYLEEIRKSQLGKNIFYTGFLKGRELAKAYASADIFAFPSTTDTFGNAVLEAQASGLPAIVSGKGGPKEIIIPNKTGLVVSTSDAAGFEEALRKLIKGSDLRKSMAYHARELAKTKSWDVIFRNFWNTEVTSEKIKKCEVDNATIQQKKELVELDTEMVK